MILQYIMEKTHEWIYNEVSCLLGQGREENEIDAHGQLETSM